MMWKEFKPALFFLMKFMGVYLVGNILYGVYIESYGDRPDMVTEAATNQTCAVLSALGEEVRPKPLEDAPKVAILDSSDTPVINIFEGCNGINVMIVFVAFVVAFSGSLWTTVAFIVAGIGLIHVANVLRLMLLYYVLQHFESAFYFFHKYMFTAILYAFVFLLWYVWVVWIVRRSNRSRQ